MGDFRIKSAVITGATGVVGTALIEKLIAQGVSVLVLARKNGRTQKLPKHPLADVRFCALDELKNFEPRGGEEYDAFFHLGWCGTYGAERADRDLQQKNIEYTLDAVRLAKKLGCAVFTGAGSQAENGVLPYGTRVSDTAPENPESEYGKAKLAAGRASRDLCKALGIRHEWCRILSAYGPGDTPRSMVMSTLLKMLKGEDCDFTKAEQIWDYAYCGDVANALYLAAANGKDGAIYAVGSGEMRTLKDYILTMARVTGTKSSLNFGAVDYYPNQPMFLCADTRKLRSDTGFAPQTDFECGIMKTAAFLKEGFIDG